MGKGHADSRSGGARYLAGLLVAALTLASVTAIVGTTGCSDRTAAVVVTAEANHTTITVAKGTIVTVKLAENPTTGYLWTMIVGPGLSLESSKFLAPSSSGVVGASGTRVWVVKAEQAGTWTLSGVYQRSWESKTAASFSLTIVVK
jgi:inhibitor of cysteine peptidase